MLSTPYSDFKELINLIKSNSYYIDEIIGNNKFKMTSNEGNIIYFFYNESRNSLFIKLIVSSKNLNKFLKSIPSNTSLTNKIEFGKNNSDNRINTLFEIKQINTSYDDLDNFFEVFVKN